MELYVLFWFKISQRQRHESVFLCERYSRPDSACALPIKPNTFRSSDIHWEKLGSLRNAFISTHGWCLLVTAAGTTPHSMGPPFLALLNDFIPWQFLAESAGFNTQERRGVVVTAWDGNSAKRLGFLAHISHVGSKAQFIARFLLIVRFASSILKMETVPSSETSINF
jgi:hypothetical protein